MKPRQTDDVRPVLNVRGAFIRRTNFSGTVLRGADLTGATNLTLEQLSGAEIDEHTLLPAYIDRSKLRSDMRYHQERLG